MRNLFKRYAVPIVGSFILGWFLASFFFVNSFAEQPKFHPLLLIVFPLIFLILWFGVKRVSLYLDKRLQWSKHLVRRIFTQLFLSWLYSLLTIFIPWIIFVTITQGLGTFRKDLMISLTINGIIVIFLLIINSIQLSFDLTADWNRVEIKNARLQKEEAKARLNALQSQVDPHFLFNSLNILAELIDTDPKRASTFLIAFSKIYRYVLSHNDKALVTLNEELQFIDQYSLLLQTRFERSFNFVIITKDEEALNGLVPPLVLQLLLENVVKHNVITSSQPLVITISYNKHRLMMQNRKMDARSVIGFGVGLENIRQRYAAFTSEEISVENGTEFFSVSIPLLTKVNS